MKKLVGIGIAVAVVVAYAGVLVLRSTATVPTETSQKAAKILQDKIDAIKAAEVDPKHKPGSTRVEISEVEFESYLLYSLKEDIPAQIDTADVQLGNETVGLDTQITFNSNATGNPVFDALVGGTQDRKSTRLNSSHLGISYA